MNFLTVFFLLITYLSAIICAPKREPLTEQALKNIISKSNNFKIDSYNLKLCKTGPLGLTEHSIVWEGKLNDNTSVAVKIIWDNEFFAREEKILGVLDAKNPRIEENGIPRVYYIGPFLQKYDSIVMTLFEGDLESRLKKQKGHLSDLSILIIFKRSLRILKYLSERNIVHNDIKPGNIFLKGPKVFISDFDISTIGDERTKRATQMFASLNYFKNPNNPQRTSKDDLESLVYSMWSIAGIARDRYEGRSGSTDARKPEGFSLLNSLEREGANAKLVSKCIQLPPALIDVFQDVCTKEILSNAKVPRYDRIIKLVSGAIANANKGSSAQPEFEWLGKNYSPSCFSCIR